MIKAVIFDMFETLVTHYECPLYFGKQISADIGIAEAEFRELWNATEEDRTLGKITLEEVIAQILHVNHKYSDTLFDMIIEKRRKTKTECFQHLHKGIIPMLDALQHASIKIGLITNCYSEECDIIRHSLLYPYFDAVCMSCELGIKKPDPEIFRTCTDALAVLPEECLYVGDGGSHELEAAGACGMHPIQATWYFKAGVGQQTKRKSDVILAESPDDILSVLKKYN